MSGSRQLLPVLFFFLFLGCRKENLPSEEWGRLAEAKLAEIEALVATVPCAKQSEATVEEVSQLCNQAFFPVVPSIKTRFDRLRREYENLYREMWRTFHEEGGVIDCFDPSPRSIRIGCEDNKLLVYTVSNLPMDEARDMATDLYGKISHYRDTLTCHNNESLSVTMVLNATADGWDVVPIAMGPGWAEWTVTLSEYQTLAHRIMEADSKVYPQRTDYPQRVTCQDGKPVVAYEHGP